jgi:serine protease Do
MTEGFGRRFTFVTLALTALVAFLLGAIFAGIGTSPTAVVVTPRGAAPPALPHFWPESRPASLPDFADVVSRVNPAVVDIEATWRSSESSPDAPPSDTRSLPKGLPEPAPPPRRDRPRLGAGSGFIIDADGSILTNHHVIERAERITVKLSDGRTFRAHVVGSDPDTDIALIKIDGQHDLPVAPLGNSDTLRMGEWVCAIGNPLTYEHTVTVGVVSYLGRKIFNASLDDYIQTDAAINYGNSGGPLINARGEVIGINAAISSKANNIGFAVPINGATAILSQLRTTGRVSRGYVGVALRDVDADLREALGLAHTGGALVQDVTENSPGQVAGLRPYDVILAIDDTDVVDDHALIQEISARPPGSAVRLRVLRDGHERIVPVKLAERPTKPSASPRAEPLKVSTPREPLEPDARLGASLREIDGRLAARLPDGAAGVIVSRVEPMGAAFEAGVERGMIILEVNRRPVRTASDVWNAVTEVPQGDLLTVYLWAPELRQHQLKAVRLYER